MCKTGCALACVCFLLGLGPADAQGWPPWADDSFGRRPWGYERRPSWDGYEPVEPRERRALTPKGGDIRDGGARPEIAPQAPAVVTFLHDYPLNSIVIDTGNRKLYYVLPDSRAYEYAISVGREGFNWTGSETVSRKQAWPDWHPPAEMRERDPSLPEKMSGGLKNPLGAMALYLGDTLYRIHGTNDAKSIGRAASSGCFRMLNANVLHLASITEIGTTVNVVAALPRGQDVSRAPEPVQVAPAAPAAAERSLQRATFSSPFLTSRVRLPGLAGLCLWGTAVMRGRSFIFALGAAVCVAGGMGENANAALAEDWKEYRNERFGLSLHYPADVFTLDRAAEAGDGQLFVSQIGDARLLVGGLINEFGFSPASYQSYLTRKSYGQYQIDYRPIGQTGSYCQVREMVRSFMRR